MGHNTTTIRIHAIDKEMLDEHVSVNFLEDNPFGVANIPNIINYLIRKELGVYYSKLDN